MRVETDGELLTLLATVDGTAVVLREDNGTSRTNAGAGRTIVFAIVRMYHTDAFFDILINTKGTEGKAFAAFGAGILVDRGIPCIVAQLARHSFHLPHPFCSLLLTDLDGLHTQGLKHVFDRTRAKIEAAYIILAHKSHKALHGARVTGYDGCGSYRVNILGLVFAQFAEVADERDFYTGSFGRCGYLCHLRFVDEGS